MEKYYKILGVEQSATDEEIKKAFVALKRKYDPNNYDKESLKNHAKEKTKEIVEAFDNIMNQKRAETIKNKENNNQTENSSSNDLKEIENLIENNILQKAEDLLMQIPQEKRTARWYFLKGVVLFKKGWILEAYNFFATAHNMDPSNEEYKQALDKANWQRRGGFNSPQDGPFGSPYPQGSPVGCSCCDICGAIMCADMCCECGAPRGPYRCC